VQEILSFLVLLSFCTRLEIQWAIGPLAIFLCVPEYIVTKSSIISFFFCIFFEYFFLKRKRIFFDSFSFSPELALKMGQMQAKEDSEKAPEQLVVRCVYPAERTCWMIATVVLCVCVVYNSA